MTDREAMKQALEALELLSKQPIEMALDYADNAIEVLRGRLSHCDRCGKKLGGDGDIHTCSPQVQKPTGKQRVQVEQPEQEPVVCRFCGDDRGCWAWQCNHCGEIDDAQKPAPPQRNPLTDEKITRIGTERQGLHQVVRAVEAAHGIKGGA